MKLFYRLVYWKRRALGTGRGRGKPARARYRRGRLRQWRYRARPALVFLVIFAIVLVASAVLGWGEFFGGFG